MRRLAKQSSDPGTYEDIDPLYQLKMAVRTQQLKNYDLPPSFNICFDIPPDNLQQFFPVKDPAYRTASTLLSNTKISPFDREKLKSWMLNQTQSLYCRETYATASCFLDMFFMHKQKIPKSEFQLLGLACLIISAKIVQSRIPSISFQVFNKDKILYLQNALMSIFKYKLNPATYVQLAQLLFELWDTFLCKQNSFKSIKYFQDCKISLIRARTIFETLDCVYLTMKCLEMQLTTLVACVFYVEHRKFCLTLFKSILKYKNKNSAQDTQFHEFDGQYQKIMSKFFEAVKINIPVFKDVVIDPKIILYVMECSRINPRFDIPAYKKFRESLLRQTYNEEITLIAKQVLSKKN